MVRRVLHYYVIDCMWCGKPTTNATPAEDRCFRCISLSDIVYLFLLGLRSLKAVREWALSRPTSELLSHHQTLSSSIIVYHEYAMRDERKGREQRFKIDALDVIETELGKRKQGAEHVSM